VGEIFPDFSGLVQPLNVTEADVTAARSAALDSLSDAVAQTDYAAMNYFVQSKALIEIRYNDLMGLVDDFQIQRDLDLLDQADEALMLEEIRAKKDSLSALYEQTLNDFQSSEDHAHFATELEQNYQATIEMIQNASETDLVQEEVEWQIFESVVHPKSP
jgi:hypothetical protein